MEQTKIHTLNLVGCKEFTASGVVDVLAFGDREIRLSLVDGRKMVLSGENFVMGGFSKQTGDVRLSGRVSSIKYCGGSVKSRGFFK